MSPGQRRGALARTAEGIQHQRTPVRLQLLFQPIQSGAIHTLRRFLPCGVLMAPKEPRQGRVYAALCAAHRARVAGAFLCHHAVTACVVH